MSKKLIGFRVTTEGETAYQYLKNAGFNMSRLLEILITEFVENYKKQNYLMKRGNLDQDDSKLLNK